jgi:hypothetical protein
MTRAAHVAIVEAEDIVLVGSINPDEIDLPDIFIDRIVPVMRRNSSSSRRRVRRHQKHRRTTSRNPQR